MTIPAGCLDVRPLQLEICFAVVKFTVPETRSYVTLIAGFVRIPFFGDLIFVRVLVAIHTSFADLPEFPFVFGRRAGIHFAFLQMAGKTRRGQVRSIEFVLRFGVVFDRENAA